MMTLMRTISLLFLAAAAFSAETPIDNDQVKVITVHENPHVKTRMHDHKINRAARLSKSRVEKRRFRNGRRAR